MLKIICAEQKAIPEETMDMLKMEKVAEEKERDAEEEIFNKDQLHTS